MRHAYLAALLIGSLPAIANAGMVTPSSSTTINSLEAALPGGTLLEQMSSPFMLDYGIGGSGLLQGSFTSSVYDIGGKLTFVYDIKLDPSNAGSAAEASKLTVASFANYTTDVGGMLGNEINIPAGRSADGAMLWIQSGSPGAGGAPTLIVATDAKSYNGQGVAGFFAGDELLGPSGQLESVNGEVSFNGFQPGAAQPVPSAIPLPPAFFTGMGILMAMALLAATKRFWETVTAR